jgi:hypothetical protein
VPRVGVSPSSCTMERATSGARLVEADVHHLEGAEHWHRYALRPNARIGISIDEKDPDARGS